MYKESSVISVTKLHQIKLTSISGLMVSIMVSMVSILMVSIVLNVI